MINFEKIIKRSFGIVKNNRYLWFLAILSGGASFGLNYYQYIYNGNSGNSDIEKFKDIVPNGGTVATLVRAEVKDVGQVLGSAIGPSSVGNIYLWIGLLALVLILIFAIIYVSLTARGALIRSVSKIDGGDMVGLKKAWMMGHKLFWRRFSFAILLVLIMFVPFVILSIPVVALAIFEIQVAAIIFGILFALLYFLFIIYASLVIPVAERILFLEGKPATESIKLGFKYFNKDWKNFVLVYLIIFGFGIGLAVVMTIIFLVLGLSIAGIGYLLYMLAHFMGIAFWIIFGLIATIVLLAISGAFNSFTSSILTLAYKDIKTKS